MKKEYILTQEQKDDKRRKIEENRQRKFEQIKRKKTMDMEPYDPEQAQQQLQIVDHSPESNSYQSVDGPTNEKVR